jgi:hypothetical protein
VHRDRIAFVFCTWGADGCAIKRLRLGGGLIVIAANVAGVVLIAGAVMRLRKGGNL